MTALLRHRVQAARNRWRRMGRAGRMRGAGLGLLALAFWVGLFHGGTRVLGWFRGLEDLGPVIGDRLLATVLVTIFAVLLFSNLVTALSSYFLASDLPFLLATPVPLERVHRARFGETLWDSSWMVLVFALPLLLAFGSAYDAGIAYPAAVALVLPPLVAIPTAIGVAGTLLLVRVFPARRTNDVFLVLSGLAVAALLVLLRFLKPERLVRPEAFGDFADFLASLSAPSTPWMPTTWATSVLAAALHRGFASPPWLDYALLLSTAAATFVLSEMLVERLYRRAWSRAQEGRGARISRWPLWEGLAARVPGVSRTVRGVALKDAKTFFRDTTQWSQLVLLGALVVVYVYNFSVLPAAGAFLAQAYLTRALGFLNLALAAFVVASVAVRFVFPAISLEGRALWILRTAPIPLATLWWSKLWMALVPIASFGLVLLLVSDHALAVGPLMTAVSAATLLLVTIADCALGLCFGAYFPRFDYENAARIPSSFGGAAYMVSAVGLVVANVALEAWPMFRLLGADLHGHALSTREWAGLTACFSATAALDVATAVVATRLGLRRLETLEL